MAKEMIVLQGKSFSIDLQSMLGSTCWGWCLTRLPQGIALIGMETIPTAAGVAPVIQRFWFGALSAVKDKAEIGFTLINLSDMTSAKQKVDVNVTVIPKDSEDFAKFSENCDDAVDPVCNSAMPYGVVLGNRSVAFKYGYPNQNMKYGYPDINLKYGFPRGDAKPVVAYGFPRVKYGFICDLKKKG